VRKYAEGIVRFFEAIGRFFAGMLVRRAFADFFQV
jgi:hypothetical protein